MKLNPALPPAPICGTQIDYGTDCYYMLVHASIHRPDQRGWVIIPKLDFDPADKERIARIHRRHVGTLAEGIPFDSWSENVIRVMLPGGEWVPLMVKDQPRHMKDRETLGLPKSWGLFHPNTAAEQELDEAGLRLAKAIRSKNIGDICDAGLKLRSVQRMYSGLGADDTEGRNAVHELVSNVSGYDQFVNDLLFRLIYVKSINRNQE